MSGDPSKCWYNLSGGNHHPQCQGTPTHENTRPNKAGDRPRWCDMHGHGTACGTQPITQPITWTSQITAKDIAEQAKYFDEMRQELIRKGLEADDFYLLIDPAGPLGQMGLGDGEKTGAGDSEPPQICKQGHGDYDPNCLACDADKAAYRRWKETR